MGQMQLLSSWCHCKCLYEQLAGSLTYTKMQSMMSGQMLFIFQQKKKLSKLAKAFPNQ